MPVDRCLIQAVIDARALVKATNARVTAVQEVFNTENAGLLEQQKQAREAQGTAEEALREAALAEYEITKSKQPGPGLGIRLVSTFIYEPERAFAWAKEHSMALLLDVPAFKALAKAKAQGTEDFVRITEIPQATIASDLAAALEGAP